MAQPASTRSARSGPMHGLATRPSHREQVLDDAGDLRFAHPAAIDPAALVTRQVEIDAGNRGHRARGAEQMQALRAAVLGGEAIHMDRDLGDHRLELLAAYGDAAVTFGECHDTDRNRNPGVDRRVWRAMPGGAAAAEPHQLRRAAADIEQDHAVGRRIDQRRAARGGEPRFGLAIDDFEVDANLVADALEKIEAVGRRAAGFGGDQPGPGDTAVPHFGAADAQGVDRTQDRRLAEQAGGCDAFAEPDDPRERVDDAEAVAGGARHQEPAVVGAKIERGIGRTGHIQPVLPIVSSIRTPTWRGCRYGDRRPRRGPLGSRSGTGPRPVARASSSIANLSPRRSPELSSPARRCGGDLALRDKV